MGAALAGILEQVDESQRPAGLDATATTFPPEIDVRALLEAAGVDATDAIARARADGDAFEGDEVDQSDPLLDTSSRLVEAIGDGQTTGTRRYKVVVIRPGRAKGVGKRYYPTRMLEANAPNFGGSSVFFNHEDLATIMRRGHGSRDPRDLAGWLQEGTWWDPAYTEPDDSKNGLRPGAVMGHADLLLEAAKFVDSLPKAVKLSVCMEPTKIRVGRTEEGHLAPIVEGVVPQSGSLDLITGTAGAGGRVLERLREAAETRYGSGHADLDTLDDATLVEAARARPAVLAALREDPPPSPSPEDDVVPDITLAQLIEAVSDEATAGQLVEALAATPAFQQLVEAVVADREAEIRADADADGQRRLALRDMRDEARRLVEAASAGQPGGILTPAYANDLLERYTLREGVPSAALDVYDELGPDGAVVKSAYQRLQEAVTLDIEREKAKLRESAPTRVVLPGGPPPSGDPSGDDASDPPADPMATRLNLDPERVRHYQTQGA